MSISVCALQAGELESVVQGVREAGTWSIVPIQWPNASALEQALRYANAMLLATQARPPDDLLEVIASRKRQMPVVVVGQEPARRANPSLWLPAMPPTSLLAVVLRQLIEGTPEVDSGSQGIYSWRRKSDMIIGNSPSIRQLLHSLDQLAPAQTPVIITGESGVGKELVARALHFGGPRAQAPFIAINCAAIPDNLFEAELFGYQRGAFTGAVAAHTGAFESANKGTLFLDEIGEMPANMQAKLLRVLETSEVQRIGSTERKKVNFRLVSATNRRLEKEVKDGRFREDLYYRIQVYPLHVAPLRERPEDIPPIVTHHLSAIGLRENRPALRLTSAALEKLLTYSWPGNVRELVNMLERAVLLAANNVIDAEHIVLRRRSQSVPPDDEPSALVSYRDAKQKFELDYFSQLMRTAGGNISLAAKLGHKTRKEVYDALKRLGLDAASYRDDQ